MNLNYEELKAWAHSVPVRYGCEDASSLMEMLRWNYVEANPVDSTRIRQILAALHTHFPDLPLEDEDFLFGRILELSYEHERTAFLDGLRMGVLLALELAS